MGPHTVAVCFQQARRRLIAYWRARSRTNFNLEIRVGRIASKNLSTGFRHCLNGILEDTNRKIAFKKES